MSDIAIIDYGLNNIKSVRKAFETVGRDVETVQEGDGFGVYAALVLPGVGTFGDGMAELVDRGLVSPILKHVNAGKPMLGICLGMQLLFSASHERGYTEGLDLLPGEVVQFRPIEEVEADNYKLPQMGWNEIRPPAGEERAIWENSLLQRTPEGADVYFVHSLYPDPEDSSDVLAVGDYGKQTFVAAVQRDNVVGTQFHPEKSGPVGVNMIETFCDRQGL